MSGGTAWVYYGEGNSALVRPVILADGFNTGPSDLDWSWNELECQNFPFISELRHWRRDIVILGYDDRSASILTNAQTAIEAIRTAIDRRYGNAQLMVGGFSMGGLATRYALVRMEYDGEDHQTQTYLSYDSPHQGAWVPISLQAFAHYLGPTSAFSQQINSRQAGPEAGRGGIDTPGRHTAAPGGHVRLQGSSEDVQMSRPGVAAVRSQA